MKQFMDANFLLQSETAQRLYHEHAAKMPIIDYHCHLNPNEIAENHQFADLTEVWLGGDHYKWRQMRANGVPEEYITGNKPAYEKFEKWAETLQCAMRNPLYHWTHPRRPPARFTTNVPPSCKRPNSVRKPSWSG